MVSYSKFANLGRPTHALSSAVTTSAESSPAITTSVPVLFLSPRTATHLTPSSDTDLDADYFNSRRMSSVASADSDSSSVLSRPEKRPPSPAHSPDPKRPRPSGLPLDAWDADDPNASPRIQLPSLSSSFQDPFQRRASLPTLASDQARTRLPAVASRAPSGLASYQFPPPDADDKFARPRLAADTQLGGLFSDQTSQSTLSSSTSPSFPSSTFSSPLSTDYSLPRSAQGLPSLQFSDSEHWTSSPASSLPGIVRPNSTPGQLSNASAPLKYDDSLRHSSLSGSFTFPPAPAPSSASNTPQQQSPQQQMYGSVARIAGQGERRASYAQSSTADAVKEEWGFPAGEFLLPSASSGAPSPSRSPTGGAQPAASSLVDRPTKKRGKLPKPTTDFLKDWLHRHSDHPYPSEEEKKQLCAATGLSMSQVSNWMINARRRILAPVHRPSSGPATTHPLPSQPQRLMHPGVSTGTLLRRASMPTDSLQLYHPLSLQSIPHADPYYGATPQRSLLLGTGGGYSQGRSASYGGGYAQAQYSFPGQQSHASSYAPAGGMYGGGGGGGQNFYGGQQGYGLSEREHSTPTPGSGYHTPQ
ncbi:hypothetical protein BV25DRAFT_726026 [Artomyces pyxidatus]|uniref:Uncharacterized protein n=1 Tax=Artomyces pyxidatus TaxID=48021 RepID=A0ACB8SZQ6_9AGAM|nr:hypothetical protein BV25DRAFT_726026 [Artomyces pyxidatus]